MQFWGSKAIEEDTKKRNCGQRDSLICCPVDFVMRKIGFCPFLVSKQVRDKALYVPSVIKCFFLWMKKIFRALNSHTKEITTYTCLLGLPHIRFYFYDLYNTTLESVGYMPRESWFKFYVFHFYFDLTRYRFIRLLSTAARAENSDKTQLKSADFLWTVNSVLGHPDSAK